MTKSKELRPIDIAVKLAGSRSDLAKKLGVHYTYVWKMVKTGRIPLEQCKPIEDATGVSRALLRPDHFA